MKVNISKDLYFQWEASTRPNSQKSIAKNVGLLRRLSPIGVDYDGENELSSSTRWVAEWSEAPSSFSSRGDGGGGGGGSDLGRVYSFF